jgi:hypothetical protein
MGRFASVLRSADEYSPLVQLDSLLEIAPPAPKARRGLGAEAFGEFKASDDPDWDHSNKQLGTDGEELVVEHECEIMPSAGALLLEKPDLLPGYTIFLAYRIVAEDKKSPLV